jgi:hypothetical protein
MDELLYSSSSDDAYTSSSYESSSEEDGIPEEISAKLFAPIPGENMIQIQSESGNQMVHPQAWLKEKYGKKKKQKYKDDAPFFAMYGKPLETPEDIQRYREERIKNFPSKANLERKQKEKEEIEKKGGIVKKEKSRGQFVAKKRERNPNLLITLLEREIQHENDVLLQCVRHIIKNKFYTDSHTERVQKKLKVYE